MKKIIFFLFFIAAALNSSSQNEYTQWYFGGQASLNFVTNPPGVLNNSAMVAPNGCSSVADASGNLLFYTDGVTVWNKQHVMMANGTLSFAGGSNAAYPMIVKQPGNSNLYYIFRVFPSPYITSFPLPPITTGLYYSVVDMSLAGTMGSVTVNNALIYTAPFYLSTTGQLHATKHANGVDYWIMIHDYPANNFRAYLLTATGISPMPVVSSIGMTYQGQVYGYMKFSPTGQKLCTSTNYAGIELYDFNTTSGLLSNPLTLLSNIQEYNYRGCEFSPDGTKLYAGHNIAGSANNSKLIQWDLSAGSAAAILSSSVNIPSNSLNPAALQLAPNGKIYIAPMSSSSFISVINSPNTVGTGCNFVANGQAISAAINSTLTSSSLKGLPNMVTCLANMPCATQTLSNPKSICAGDFYEISNHTYSTAGTYSDTLQNVFGCNGIVIVTTQLTVKPTYTVNNLQSICAGSSYVFNSHSYTQAGTYRDTLQNASGCDSIIITQLIVNSLPEINVSAGSTICINETVTLTASGANTYTWSTGQSGGSISVAPAVTTTYSVYGTNSHGCAAGSQILVSVSLCTSIGELKIENEELKIYPNPAQDVLQIEATGILEFNSAFIYNSMGQLLREEEISFKDKATFIKTDQIPDGVYFLRLSCREQAINKRFVIAK